MNVIKKKYNQIIRVLHNINLTLDNVKKIKNSYEKDLYSYKSPKVNLGQIQTCLNFKKTELSSLSEVEFQVFSQFGDDGIIQWLINNIDVPNKTFVEFGVEKYIEANTRFLLFNDNWNGLVIDGDKQNVDYIKADIISSFFNLQSICSFITKDNINELIRSKGFDNELGLLSIDIDGNDYWIWRSLKDINPVIVISEYNAEFGFNPWTIPYKEGFVWDRLSDIYYWGSSLMSLCDLADEKGYSFIGCNSHGNNAYFIRNDKMKNLRKISCEEGFMKAKFSLKRKENGEQFTEIEKQKELVGKEIYNSRSQKMETINSNNF